MDQPTDRFTIGDLLTDEQSKAYIRIFRECKRDGLTAEDFERRTREEIMRPDWDRIHDLLVSKGMKSPDIDMINISCCMLLMESFMDVRDQLGDPPPGYFDAPRVH